MAKTGRKITRSVQRTKTENKITSPIQIIKTGHKTGSLLNRILATDTFFHKRTGRGSNRDKVENLRPGLRDFINASEAREWYKTSGILQSVVDAVADDATRAWIKITTNRDVDNPDTGKKGLNISRVIMNRLEELKTQAAIKKLVRNTRIYNEGGFMFIGILETIPPKGLDEPINGVEKIEFLNVFGPQFGHVDAHDLRVTSKNFGRPTMFTLGSGAPGSIDVNMDRMVWLVQKFEEEDNHGISTIQQVLDSIKAIDTGLWSANHILFELAVKVIKSPDVRKMKRDDIFRALEGMQNQMSTMSAILLRDDESFEKKTLQIPGIKDVFDFVFENISAASQIPKSKIMGNSQGVITAGQYDIINYFTRVEEFQKNEIKPILDKLIDLIIKERRGPVIDLLGNDVEHLDWNFEFNSLWTPDPSEKSRIGLQDAQADQFYFTMGVKTTQEIRKNRFPELEDFEEETQVEKAIAEVEAEGLNMTPPEMSGHKNNVP